MNGQIIESQRRGGTAENPRCHSSEATRIACARAHLLVLLDEALGELDVGVVDALDLDAVLGAQVRVVHHAAQQQVVHRLVDLGQRADLRVVLAARHDCARADTELILVCGLCGWISRMDKEESTCS